MKKLFTLMAAALMAVCANAQTKLTLGAGWNSSLEDVVLTGDVEFNFKHSYASIEMDITEVDLAAYPSYEIVLSSDTPSDKLQFNVVSDAGEGWSGSFAEGTTTPAAFIPDGSTKLTKIALQACNVENLGKVEIVSANLIDKDGNKTPLNYKVPASWAADVVTPITNATINFTTGGQWNTAAVKGAEGKINQKFTINIDNTFPEGVQFKIQTTERNGDAGSIYAVFPAGEKTFSVDVEETVPGETITEIAIQNTIAQDPFKLVNCSVTMTEIGGGEEAGGKTWDFTTTSAEVIAALEADATIWKKTQEGTAPNQFDRYAYQPEIAKDTYVELSSIGFAPGAGIEVGRAGSKMSAGTIRIDVNSRIQLNCSNGVFKIKNLKAGDVVKIQISSANSSEARTFTITNGDKTSVTTTADGTKSEESITVTADGDLVLQQSKAINIYAIAVNAEIPTGIQETVAPVKVINNGAIYNLAGQKVNETYKGIVIKNGKKYIQK